MNDEFRLRLNKVFDNATMAEIARQLNLPHATVRNYFQGRLPATEVLIKIANETGVSLNWLLLGKGEMYAGDVPPITIGRFLEERIGEIVDRKLAGLGAMPVDELGNIDLLPAFDLEAALLKWDDPQRVMNEWLRHEGRDFPSDYGVVFFRGWESFSHDEKIEALRDAKKVLDRSVR